MHKFDFFSATRIAFGRGRVREVGSIAKSFGSRALVVYNGGQPGDNGPVDRVEASLREAGVTTAWFRQKGEPRVQDVENGVAAAREAGCDVLVGLGGGSAIDCAKAVAGVVANGGSPLDYMEVIGRGQPLTRPATPWVAVPTTAGTGAEVTRNAVIGEPSRKFKASLRSELLLPKVALVDPELGVGVPPDVTAASGMDALCQLIESYTSTGAGPMTNALALSGLEMAVRSLSAAYHDGLDLEAREGMALAALLSGIALTNAGLGAVHGFAAPLGANFPAPHGVICAALLPNVIASNVKALKRMSPHHPVIARYTRISTIIRGGASSETAIDHALEVVSHWVRTMKIPSLSTFGVRESDVPAMVQLAKKSSSMRFNPVTLSDDELADVLRRAM